MRLLPRSVQRHLGSRRRSASVRHSPRHIVRGVLIACAIVASGCTSSSVTSSTSTEPSVVKCQVSLAMSTAAIGADGGSGALSVSTQPECAWEAVSGASWISDLRPASGQGTGEVQFVVTANPDPVARQADIKVNGQSAGVRQDSAPCRFGISASSQSVDAGGGTITVSVTGANSCSWTASSSVSWVTIVSGASGTASGTVRLQVSANTGDARTGALAIAGQTFTVAQGSATVNPACTYRWRCRVNRYPPVADQVPSLLQRPRAVRGRR